MYFSKNVRKNGCIEMNKINKKYKNIEMFEYLKFFLEKKIVYSTIFRSKALFDLLLKTLYRFVIVHLVNRKVDGLRL